MAAREGIVCTVFRTRHLEKESIESAAPQSISGPAATVNGAGGNDA